MSRCTISWESLPSLGAPTGAVGETLGVPAIRGIDGILDRDNGSTSSPVKLAIGTQNTKEIRGLGITELRTLKKRLLERLDKETDYCELALLAQDIDVVETLIANLKGALSLADPADSLAKARSPANTCAHEIQLDLFEGVPSASGSDARDVAGAKS